MFRERNRDVRSENWKSEFEVCVPWPGCEPMEIPVGYKYHLLLHSLRVHHAAISNDYHEMTETPRDRDNVDDDRQPSINVTELVIMEANMIVRNLVRLLSHWE